MYMYVQTLSVVFASLHVQVHVQGFVILSLKYMYLTSQLILLA